MSVPSAGPRPSNRHRRRQSPVVGIILVIVGMVVLFGAGYGLSRIIQGSTGGGDAASSAATTGEATSAAPEPEPCVTVTVTPGAGLPSAAQVTTNVYNATDRTGLAASTAERASGSSRLPAGAASAVHSSWMTSSSRAAHNQRD